jgi:PST family polysaccharide transporter
MFLPAAEDEVAVTSPPPATGLRRFVRGSLGSGISVVARAGGALVLNKLLAVYGGPGGLTLLAHFQNLLSMLLTLPNEGVNVGIVKYLAPRRPGSPGWQLWFGAGLLLNAGMLLLGLLVLLPLHKPLLGVFSPSVGWVLGLCGGMVLVTGYYYLLTTLLAAQRLTAYIVLTVILSLMGPMAVAGSLAAGWPVSRVLLAYLFGQGLVLLPSAGVCWRLGLLRWQWQRPSQPALLALGRFLLMALSVLLCSKAVDFVLRDVLISRFSLQQTGLWQATAKLSDNYTMVFSAVMGAVYYPRLAALVHQPAARRAYIRAVFGLLILVLALGMAALWLLRDWLLPLLFDGRFAAARTLLGPQLIGDWAKLLSWTLLYQLMAEARVVHYVLVQVVSAVVYTGLLVALLPHFGLYGVPVAHGIRFGLLLFICLLYFKPLRPAS